MFIGLLLVGSLVGAVSGLVAFITGSSVWMALLIYSGVGVLSVLGGALGLVLRPMGGPTESGAPGDLAPAPRG